MNDPYKVLGVTPNATDEQIKDAYRELAKKYHPDNYGTSSPLTELAQERMQEINAAYDEVTKMRKNGGQSGAYGGAASGSYGSYTGANAGAYASIRMLIQQRQLERADAELERIPQEQRDAEWFFLKGSVCYARGWLNEAYDNFSRAHNLNPANPEYASAYRQMSFQRAGGMNGNPYGGYRTQRTAGGCSGCDMCSSLICADCCCECMGGDLISCC